MSCERTRTLAAGVDASSRHGARQRLSLGRLFGEVASQIWRDSKVDPDEPLRVDQRVVVAALQHYFMTCSGIYLQAAAVKMSAAAQLTAAIERGEAVIPHDMLSAVAAA